MILNKLLTFLLPHICVLCGQVAKRQQDLCEDCYQDLPRYPYTDQIQTPFIYQMPITKLILDLKFKHSLAHARVLGELLGDYLCQHYQTHTLPEMIIPIPLHPTRIKERGFNQTVEIGRFVASAVKRPLYPRAVSRIKHTLPQATLLKSQREKNVKDAFYIHMNLKNRHIAVMDDVITTGYTMKEFCHTLALHGVRQIDIWCAARPLPL